MASAASELLLVRLCEPFRRTGDEPRRLRLTFAHGECAVPSARLGGVRRHTMTRLIGVYPLPWLPGETLFGVQPVRISASDAGLSSTALLGLALHTSVATWLRSLLDVQILHHYDSAPNVEPPAKKW